MDTPATVQAILSLEPWDEVELSATRRTRSVRVAQSERAIQEALACHEYTRASSVLAQRRADTTVVINITYFE